VRVGSGKGWRRGEGTFASPKAPGGSLPRLWLCRATAHALRALGLLGPTCWFNPLAWQKKNRVIAAMKVSRAELLWLLEGSDELRCWQKVGRGLCGEKQ